MRLCFVSNPNSTHTRRWVGWFARHGHTVCVLADVTPVEAWDGVELIDLTKISQAPVVRFPTWAVWLRRFLRRWQPDILHAHRVNSAGWVAAASGFHPLVVTPWGTDLYHLDQASRVERWLARLVLRGADLVTADAQDLLNTAGRYGANPGKLKLIQWGVDLEHFHPAPAISGPAPAISGPAPADEELRAELNLGNGPVILSPRGVNRIYNLDTVIQAMPGVRSAVNGAILLLRDYNTDPEYKKYLESLISSLDLVDAVRWLGRIEPWEKLADIYRLAAVVVSVPSSDSTPVSVLEALACGIPVIATDLPALREWLVPEESGIFVRVGDAPGLTQAICRILVDKDLAERLAGSGPCMVAERANHDSEMMKMEGLYRELAGKEIARITPNP